MNRLKVVSVALALLLTCLLGCGKGIQGLIGPNSRPTIEITCGAVNSRPDSLVLLSYSVTFCWSSFDPDGSVDHYEYATSVNDTDLSQRPKWLSTRLHQATVQFKADSVFDHNYDNEARRLRAFTRPQTFCVRAVDNNGALSPWDCRVFNALTVAPTTSIRVPASAPGVYSSTGPSITVRWQGQDLDATDPKHLPVRYHLFLKDVTPAPGIYGVVEGAGMVRQALRIPSSFYVGGDTTSYTFKLLINHTYCLVIKALDQAGAEEPYPTADEGAAADLIDYNSIGRNVALFTAASSIVGPTLDVVVGPQAKSFSGYDPTSFLSSQVGTNTPLSVLWLASAASYGGLVENYSYALDINDPTNENPKVIRPGGFSWTSPDERSTSAELPGWKEKGTHYFYVRCYDNSGYRTIATIQIDVIQITFAKPILFMLDSPGINLGAPTTEFLTKDELVEFWRDILETNRSYVDISDTLTYPGGRCIPMAGKAEFYIVAQKPLNEGVPLSVLGAYRVLAWTCPVSSIGAGSPKKTVLHRMVDPAARLANNLFTYLQAGGNVWAMGGGFAGQLAIKTGYPQIANNPTSKNNIGGFAFDFLGTNGPDTLAASAPPVSNTALKDTRLRSVEPYPVPFVRQTAFGRRLTTISPLTLDMFRYDTMQTSNFSQRASRAAGADPAPGSVEIVSGGPLNTGSFPSGFNTNPDSATWQPIAIAKTIGPLAEAYSDRPTRTTIAINNAVIGWYKKGTTLTGAGAAIPAPYELYFFGFPMELMNREEVRQLADIILETRGWNIWRGSCPPNAGRLAADRAAQLDRNLQRLSEAQRREIEKTARPNRVSALPKRSR